MGDQGRWFKLWVSALSDPDLANLSLEDFGRWCAFGAFLKAHGAGGRIVLKPPAVALQQLFRLDHFEAVVKVLESFPNCRVFVTEPDRHTTVTVKVEWKNWQKYQVDNSADRTRSWREKRRSAGRFGDGGCDDDVTVIEEKRRDEMRREESTTPPTPPRGKSASVSPPGFQRFYTAYPKHEAREAALRAWRKLAPDADLLTRMLGAIDRQRASRKWQEGIIPMPATWLNQRRWEDEVETPLPFDSKTASTVQAAQRVLDRRKGDQP